MRIINYTNVFCKSSFSIVCAKWIIVIKKWNIPLSKSFLLWLIIDLLYGRVYWVWACSQDCLQKTLSIFLSLYLFSCSLLWCCRTAVQAAWLTPKQHQQQRGATLAEHFPLWIRTRWSDWHCSQSSVALKPKKRSKHLSQPIQAFWQKINKF